MSRLAGWLLCAVPLLAPPVQAQDQPRSLLDGERSLIFVQGTAEVRVPPEKAVISIDIERRDKEAARAAGELRVVVERANQIVNDFGNGATLRSDETFASPIWDWKARRVITHLVRQSLHVDLPAAHAAQLVPLLLEAGVGRVGEVDYEVKDSRVHRDEARRMAVRAAREKAEAVTAELQQKLGRAHRIEIENAGGRPSSQHFANSSNLVRVSGGAESTTSETPAPSDLVFSATVTVAFELQ
jgi:uncharacterized protein